MILTDDHKKAIIERLIVWFKEKDECEAIEISESGDTSTRKWFSVIITPKTVDGEKVTK